MKRFFKNALSVVLALTIIFSSAYVGFSEVDFADIKFENPFAVKTKAASSGTCGDNLTWTLDDNGTLTISGTGRMVDFNSYSSTPWYSPFSTINTVVIGDNVTSIGKYAFANRDITSVTIGENVKYIGDYAFKNCLALNAVYITDLGIWCGIPFNDYYTNPIYYAKNLYLNGELVTDLVIPEGVSCIGNYSFKNCSLATVTIPASVTSIGVYAFSDCTGLTSITIPDSVTSIGGYAFSGCTGLTSITIPDSVTSIGEYAFYECKSINAVFITDIAKWCAINFSDYYANPLCKAKNLYLNGEIVKDLAIPDSVTSIGDFTFCNCTSLASITLPDSVISIGDYTFYNCTSLTSIMIPYSVTSIGDYAFSHCTSPTSIIIPDSVTSIGESTFSYCENLASVTLPNSITSIGKQAFYFCTNLNSVTIPDSVTSIGESAFSYCENLASVTIPDSVTSMDKWAFYECTNITSVYITDVAKWCSISFANAYSNPLYYADQLYINRQLSTDIIIAEDVTKISSLAFYGCAALTSVIVGNDVTSIGDYAFAWCHNLVSAKIGNDVTSIGDYAFTNCENLASVTIGNSVMVIGEGAFHNCLSLKDIYYNGSQSEWKNINIYGFNEVFLYESSATIHYHLHSYGDWVVDIEPTCTEVGSKSRHCTVCDVKTNITTIETTPHTFDAWVITQEPTCTEEGSAKRVCIKCGFVQYESMYSSKKVIDSTLYPESDHDYENNTNEVYSFEYEGAHSLELTFSPLTNTETDYDYIYIYSATGSLYGKYSGSSLAGETITLTGDSFKIKLTSDYSNSAYGFSFDLIVAVVEDTLDIIEPIGHNYSTEWTVDIVPNCTTNGLKSRHCSRCSSKIDDIVIMAVGHTEIKDDAVSATCTQSGKTEGSHCSVCNAVVVAQQTVPAKGHTEVKDAAVSATCTAAGKTEGKHCSVCNTVIVAQQTVPAKGHTEVKDAAVVATCTTAGKTEGKHCSVCKAVIVAQQTVPAKGHTPVKDNAVGATCTQAGKTEGSHCSVCNVVIVAQQTVPAKGHTEVKDNAVAATCTQPGKTEGKHCSVCNTVIVAQQTVPAKGHTEVKDNAVAATCTTAGKTEGKHCSVCNTVIVAQQTVAAKGHIASVTKYNAEKRLEYKECTVCKVVLESKNIPLNVTTITSCYNEVKGVQLKWNAVSDATSYKIYRKLPTQTEWAEINSTTALEYQDTNVTGNKVYQYVIKAVDKYGNESDYSAQRECRFIETPTLLSRANAIGGVTITWTKVAGATSYRIYRRGAGTDYWYYLGDVSSTQNTFFDKESSLVSSGNYYRYTVRASYNGKDSSGKDYLIYSGFDTNGLYLKYMATPKLTSISNATGGLYIKWNAVAGVTNGYRVYRRGAGSTYWKYLGTVKTTYYTDSEVKNNSGEYYRYTVIADGGYYSAFDTNGLFLKRLVNPTLKSATSAKAGITVKWGAVSGTTGYYVYRKTANSGWVRIAAVGGTNNTTYLDKTAKKGVTYTYTVRAVSGTTTSYFNSGISCKDKY